MTLTIQFYTMAFMTLGGFYLGMAVETFRRISHLWKGRIWLVYGLEAFFWSSQTFLLFYLLYRINAGELRVYVFAACLLGFSIYKVIGARLYKIILEHIIQFLIGCYRFLTKLVHIFIIVPIKAILYVLLLISQALFSLVKFVLMPVIWLFKGLYYLLPKRIQLFFPILVRLYSIIKNTWIKWIKYVTFKGR